MLLTIHNYCLFREIICAILLTDESVTFVQNKENENEKVLSEGKIVSVFIISIIEMEI